jgi:ABC-type glycerol-3-phosphate transport system substrate-binding protein
MLFRSLLVLSVALLSAAAARAQTEFVIATVNNGHMIEMQKLTPQFEKANPDIKVKWVTLEEVVLRQRVTTDIATQGGQFDVMTIGMYETPIWGKKGWLKELKTDAAYDVDNLLPVMRNGLLDEGKLFAAPFYGESSMLMYRKDLADKAGIKFAEAEKKAIDSANPNDSTLLKSPYVGVQFAAIPEFQAIGVAVGQQMSSALSGKATVDAALKASPVVADREMRKGGYYK